MTVNKLLEKYQLDIDALSDQELREVYELLDVAINERYYVKATLGKRI